MEYFKTEQGTHRKWPTPEQFREEYGREYPEDGAVWVCFGSRSRRLETYSYAKHTFRHSGATLICACTPYGTPPESILDAVLKPCPFCGSGVVVVHIGRNGQRVQCNNCGCRTMDFDSEEVAVSRWDARDKRGTR